MNQFKILNALIVDDSEQARELLRLMISELATTLRIVGEASNVDEAKIAIESLKPDLIFLDINMPGKSGMDLLVEMEEKNFEVIFTTAYNQYAVQAFKLSAIDYLLKPIQEDELMMAIEKAIIQKNLKTDSQRMNVLMNNLKEKSGATLAIPLNAGHEYIRLNNIEFIEAERAYSVIHLTDGSQKLVSKPMGFFEEALESTQQFLKVHRSYIANLSNVESFQKKNEAGLLVFKSAKKADVSRSYKKELIEALQREKTL
ncbi:MAG: response regulator transcription factor [Bacteroidetes bacterium]|nr:response regulator transcription factor [Bacteroidota bacterium]MCA6444842.1 response regulator transcription factor [Bacteroidota bacterium]